VCLIVQIRRATSDSCKIPAIDKGAGWERARTRARARASAS
jgi:hypothetical protein